MLCPRRLRTTLVLVDIAIALFAACHRASTLVESSLSLFDTSLMFPSSAPIPFTRSSGSVGRFCLLYSDVGESERRCDMDVKVQLMSISHGVRFGLGAAAG